MWNVITAYIPMILHIGIPLLIAGAGVWWGLFGPFWKNTGFIVAAACVSGIICYGYGVKNEKVLCDAKVEFARAATLSAASTAKSRAAAAVKRGVRDERDEDTR